MFTFTQYCGKKKRPLPVEPPSLEGAPLIETHAHLDMLQDPITALARAAFVGISGLLTIADVSEKAQHTYDTLDLWLEDAQMLLDAHAPGLTVPKVWIIIGQHPHNARRFNAAAETNIRALAKDPRTVGLGELGLDYHYDYSPRDQQRAAFVRHLQIAHELDLPIIIHLREAHEDGLAILQKESIPKAGAILHCFNRDFATAEPFLELGCTLGFGGPVTFKSANELREAVAATPTGRFIVETDCPFMAPTPFRGQKCEPAHTLWVADAVAQARATTLPDLARETTATARRIFTLS